jgi:hypothetical protein
MAEKLDYKRAFPDLYQPSRKPGLVQVPPMTFLAVDGHGDPNEPEGEYHKAVELLYTLCYTIKMSKLGGRAPQGYFEYVVPPLEGFWWLEDETSFDFFNDKSRYCWISVIRQPEFVTEAVLDWAREEARRKKPELDVSRARLMALEEGLCVQAMHIGPFSDEPQTLEIMEAYIRENGLHNDIGGKLSDWTKRRHHEIYMSDPRKTKPESMKTVLRHPIRQEG